MPRGDQHGNKPSFLKLDGWIFEHGAYRDLGLGSRALLWELIRVYNGYNNGRLFLSHRLAAARLNCSRNTVARYYQELEAAGFLIKTRGHCLGPDGMGQSAHWALTHLPRDGMRAQNSFKYKTPAT